MDCYIYYKSSCDNRKKVLQSVRQLHESLREILGNQMLLQRRPLAIDGVDTWMEVYRNIPVQTADEFANLIAPSLAKSKLENHLLGARRIELFIDTSEF